MPTRLFLLALAACLGPVARGQTVPVGVARVDITPEGPIRLHGYAARQTESVGVQLPIHAKALAVGGDEPGASVLVAVDSLGVPDTLTEALAARLQEKAGIARERLVVAASHTHSAPVLTGLAPNLFGKPLPDDQQARIDRYTRELLGKLESVCLAALRDRKPATLAWGQGSVDFARNRRTPGGPVDPSLPVLRVSDPSGAVRAVLVNYACHCTTLDPADNLVSGDWAGYAQQAIEGAYPGAVALTVVGCGADANPADRTSLEAARKHGRAIGDEARRLIGGSLQPLTAAPVGRFRRIAVPFDTPPTRAQLEELVQKGGYPGYNARTQLARLDRGEPLQAALDYPVQTWTFGDDLEMVFLAGEVVVDYVLRLKRELDPARLWVTSYANDVPCYIPSERVLKEGGYEGGGAMVYYGRPTRLKPGVEAIIDAAVLELSPPAFRSAREDKAAVDAEPKAPLSPDQALRSFRLKPGLTIELVAAEPLVVDPVAIDFGADNRLWVCEMHDYPAGLDGKYTPGGRIKVLEDTNEDGRYDKATTFLDGLPFPTGVMAWRQGVLVCAAPQILYAEDTNGDGRADLRNVLYEGFRTENYQARVNGLTYGLDNWIYGANGLIGGQIRGTATGSVIDIGGRDFRMNPDTGIMQPAAGLSQQGRVRNDRGEWFGNNNSAWLYHFVLPDQDAGRNPSVASPNPAVYVPRDVDSARLFPASETLARFNHPESANRVTSACGPAIYRDTLLGEDLAGNAFICEPVHNLVHREVLTRDGVTFAGNRAEDEATREFLASTDHWFRPVQVRTGPDGALWVVDMYRYVIEHPRWISPDRLKTLDVRAGDDKGRIYRIRRDDAPPRRVPRIDRLETAELASLLDDTNGTFRDNVQRALVHRADRAAVATLERIAREGVHPEGRLQALCTLDGLGALTGPLVVRAAGDPSPAVRGQAARLIRPFLATDPAAGRSLVELSNDPDITVRFQAALSLGEWDDPEAGRALGRLATADVADPWIRAAVLSSAGSQAGVILATVLRDAPDPASPPIALVGPLIATSAAWARPEAVHAAVQAVTTPDDNTGRFASWKLDALADLLEATGRPDAKARVEPARWEAAIDAARASARDDSLPSPARAIAVRLLGRQPPRLDDDLAILAELIRPHGALAVQEAALRSLARVRDDRASTVLVGSWNEISPALRTAVLDALLARASWSLALLDAVEKGAIPAGEIDAAHRQAYAQHVDPAVRTSAEAVLAATQAPSRQAVIDSFAVARSLSGDLERGGSVFEKLCSGCHRLNDRGHAVGPDLAALTDTTPEALSLAILDPNREVDARYAAYNAALVDGRVLNGLIAAETGNAITLKRQDGQQDIVLRDDLEALRSTGMSLMPEGLERDLTPQSLADLIAYVAAGGAAPKSQPGNHPELVRPSPDGSIRLEAETAAIYGETLVYEPPTRNLGYWHSTNDRAVWTFEVGRAGAYTLSMEWACAEDSAGQTLLIRLGGQEIPTVIGGTGTWADYRSIFVEEVRLPAGRHKLEVRAASPPTTALLDLRALLLTPR
jgi:putative membrane-bound dehydrogenase-like protein